MTVPRAGVAEAGRGVTEAEPGVTEAEPGVTGAGPRVVNEEAPGITVYSKATDYWS